MTMDPAMNAAYEACRRLQRRHDPTYYWATRRLPADVRPATHAVVEALVDAAQRHRLPLDELAVYMRSMRVDCGPVRIASDEELDTYMDGSAGSVGRIMAPLLGVPERFHADFGHLGQAFQLANFIRDVREDWAMDRICLPGLGDADLDGNTPAVRAGVAHQVAR